MKKEFDVRCYEVLGKVPMGKVVTYKEIARKLGSRGYRAVGNIMNKNSDLINIQCFRVVRSDGKVGGYSRGVKKKIELLRKEGIEVRNNRIDLKKYGWRL